MADVAISTVPTISTLDSTDKFYVNNDPSTSHAISQIALSDVLTIVQSGVQLTSAKGVANGYASLDSGGHVPSSQLPALASGVSAINTSLTGNVTNVQLTTQKGVANGYASLDGTAKVPVAQLPGVVQNGSRSTNTTTSTVIDFNYQQQTFLVQGTATFSFANLTPGAETSVTLVMDTGSPFLVSWPGTNFAWDTTVPTINPYVGQTTTLGFQVREDGVTVVGFGTPVDRSQIFSPFTEQEIFPREALGTAGNGNPLNAGLLRLTYFKASRTQLVNSLAVWVATASVGATHQYLCLCDVDPTNWTTTIVAITADVTDNSLFGTASAAGTKVTKALTAAYQVYSGKWYAFGCSSIGQSTSPGLASTRAATSFNVYADLPMLAASVTQATYPTVGTSYVAPGVHDTRNYAHLV